MKTEFLKLVGNELRIIRLEHNDLQYDLASKSRVAPSTISRYESGEGDMSLAKIEQILAPYNISMLIFFNRVYAKTQKVKEGE